MNSIVIIGTHPPCPRCRLLTNVVTAKVNAIGLDTEVRHLSYTDEEAREFARALGLEPGTAKDVAKRNNVEIDMQKIAKLIQNGVPDPDCEYRDYNDCKWSYALDELLRPFENKAKDVGILMTPVLIINGHVKHNGSVPRLSKIEEWLLELQDSPAGTE